MKLAEDATEEGGSTTTTVDGTNADQSDMNRFIVGNCVVTGSPFKLFPQ